MCYSYICIHTYKTNYGGFQKENKHLFRQQIRSFMFCMYVWQSLIISKTFHLILSLPGKFPWRQRNLFVHGVVWSCLHVITPGLIHPGCLKIDVVKTVNSGWSVRFPWQQRLAPEEPWSQLRLHAARWRRSRNPQFCFIACFYFKIDMELFTPMVSSVAVTPV